MDTPPTKLINPFVGLRAFEETEDYLFFGRGKEIDELLKKFNESRFLAVIGSSGSGKSSLVKSGMLPAIYSGFMSVGSNWRVALMQPGENPIGYLSAQLAKEGTLYNNTDAAVIPYESIIESRLRRSENGLIHVYTDAHLPPKENLLIVVDQFEELFRFSKYEKDNKLGKSDAMHFIQILLTAALQQEYPIYVLLTMRSDFLGDCAEFRGLPEAINNGQYLVPRMTRDEIREAVTGPVAVSGATISDRLVTRLLNDINNDTDQLPVLQHAMMRTWEAWYKRKELDKPIDFRDYEDIGTMKSALSQHADEAYDDVPAGKEKEVCELMFKALTDKGADLRGTRRPRSISDLCLLTSGNSDEVIGIVEIFRKTGRTFLMPPSGIELKKDSIIDISHESLMRVWERLVKWADEESRSSDIYLRLAESAMLKDLGQRGLLKDPELELALKWKDKNKPSEKWAEGFHADYARVMAYLDESRVEDLADKKAEAKLAEEKLIEEKKAAKRKLKNVIFGLLIFSLAGAFYSIQRLYVLRDLANANADSARIQSKIAQSQRDLAKRNADSARIQRDSAEFQRALAIRNADTARANAAEAQKLSELANANADTARANAAEAKKQTELAKWNENQTKIEKDKAYNNSLKNAASVYARLIREGPYAKKEIQDSAFDFKLVAFTEHLDSLGPLILKNIRNEYPDYKLLLEKLYYNNDLYEKIYTCLNFTSPNAKKVLFDMIPNSGKFSGDYDSSNPAFKKIQSSLKSSGKKLIKIIENKKDKLIFCSTNDNWIYVYSKGSDIPDNKIAMGAMATAIDYSSDNRIIYFGLESGDIGFIRYDKDKMNQPVFENTLNTPVTAVQYFTFLSGQGINKGMLKHFLLVAGKKSKVVVYELADKDPVPDRRLLGNSLPEKTLLDVVNAKFDAGKICIEVKSSRPGSMPSYYSWNPFTAEAFEVYKRYKKGSDYTTSYWLPTKNY